MIPHTCTVRLLSPPPQPTFEKALHRPVSSLPTRSSDPSLSQQTSRPSSCLYWTSQQFLLFFLLDTIFRPTASMIQMSPYFPPVLFCATWLFHGGALISAPAFHFLDSTGHLNLDGVTVVATSKCESSRPGFASELRMSVACHLHTVSSKGTS